MSACPKLLQTSYVASDRVISSWARQTCCELQQGLCTIVHLAKRSVFFLSCRQAAPNFCQFAKKMSARQAIVKAVIFILVLMCVVHAAQACAPEAGRAYCAQTC